MSTPSSWIMRFASHIIFTPTPTCHPQVLRFWLVTGWAAVHQRSTQSAHPAAQPRDHSERSTTTSSHGNGNRGQWSGRTADFSVFPPSALSRILSAAQCARQRHHKRHAGANGRTPRRRTWYTQGGRRCNLGFGAREQLVSRGRRCPALSFDAARSRQTPGEKRRRWISWLAGMLNRSGAWPMTASNGAGNRSGA